MKKVDFIKSIKEVLGEKKRPGLWANINAKQKRGGKPAHGNSNAHKDAVAAGKAIKKEEEGGEQGLNVGDLISFKADPKAIWKILGIQGDTYRINQQGERSISYKPQSWLHNMIAKGKATVVEGDAMKKEGEGNENELAGIEMELPSSTVSKINAKVKDPSTMAQAILHYINSVADKEAPSIFKNPKLRRALELLKDLGDDKPSNETANPQDGKAAPYGSGYKKVKESMTRRDMVNIIREVIQLHIKN